MLGNVCIQYSTLTLTAVLGHQGTNNKLIKRFSNYKYIPGVPQKSLPVFKIFWWILTIYNQLKMHIFGWGIEFETDLSKNVQEIYSQKKNIASRAH